MPAGSLELVSPLARSLAPVPSLAPFLSLRPSLSLRRSPSLPLSPPPPLPLFSPCVFSLPLSISPSVRLCVAPSLYPICRFSSSSIIFYFSRLLPLPCRPFRLPHTPPHLLPITLLSSILSQNLRLFSSIFPPSPPLPFCRSPSVSLRPSSHMPRRPLVPSLPSPLPSIYFSLPPSLPS